MKKIMLVIAVTGLMVAAGQVWAGSACAAKCGMKSAAKSYSDKCSSGLTGIELTSEQEAKVASIKAECKDAGMTKAACDSSMVKIREVLTEEQRAKYDAACGYGG